MIYDGGLSDVRLLYTLGSMGTTPRFHSAFAFGIFHGYYISTRQPDVLSSTLSERLLLPHRSGVDKKKDFGSGGLRCFWWAGVGGWVWDGLAGWLTGRRDGGGEEAHQDISLCITTRVKGFHFSVLKTSWASSFGSEREAGVYTAWYYYVRIPPIERVAVLKRWRNGRGR